MMDGQELGEVGFVLSFLNMWGSAQFQFSEEAKVLTPAWMCSCQWFAQIFCWSLLPPLPRNLKWTARPGGVEEWGGGRMGRGLP